MKRPAAGTSGKRRGRKRRPAEPPVEDAGPAITRRRVKRAGPKHPAAWAIFVGPVRVGTIEGRRWRSSRAAIRAGVETRRAQVLAAPGIRDPAERWRVARSFIGFVFPEPPRRKRRRPRKRRAAVRPRTSGSRAGEAPPPEPSAPTPAGG